MLVLNEVGRVVIFNKTFNDIRDGKIPLPVEDISNLYTCQILKKELKKYVKKFFDDFRIYTGTNGE